MNFNRTTYRNQEKTKNNTALFLFLNLLIFSCFLILFNPQQIYAQSGVEQAKKSSFAKQTDRNLASVSKDSLRYKNGKPQERKSELKEIIEPDNVEIVNFYGQDYYKFYMTPDKLVRKFNSNGLDLDCYKGFYLQLVQEGIEDIADSLKVLKGVDSVLVVSSTSIKVFMTESIILQNLVTREIYQLLHSIPDTIYTEIQ